ncbi:glycosyltransferase [Salinithrix halophila]|uniref:Glycosyltransferase n=2 Tax=Salinithrix halophila TaxID=1485204 RepID=A0ABV8JHX1_9BACL
MKTLSRLGENVIGAFRRLERSLGNFHIQTYYSKLESREKLFQRIRFFHPHIILVFCKEAHAVNSDIRKWAPKVPVGLWVVNDPYHIQDYEWMVPYYDFMVTQDSGCLPFYRDRRNKPAFHLPLAVNPTHYFPGNVKRDYQSDVCFVGSAWSDRIRLMDHLIPLLSGKKVIIVGEGWEKLKHYSRLKKSMINRNIPPSETARYYNGAKIVLNIHRPLNDINKNPYHLPACTPNNRTFDIAACHSFQLVSRRRDLGRLYRLGEEIITYKNLKDLKQKIDYYLIHDKQREEIAGRAYRRTLRDHTYTVRMRQLIHIMHRFLRSRS